MNAPAPQAMTHADTQTIAAALGIEKRTTERRASKEAWPFIEQPGRGGKKRLYSLNGLPKAVHDALTNKHLSTALAEYSIAGIDAPASTAVAVLSCMTPTKLKESSRAIVAATAADERQRVIRNARLGILNAIARGAQARRITTSVSINAWLGGVKDGSMAPAQLLWCCLANNKNGFEWDIDWSSGHAVAVPRGGQPLAEFARKLSRETLFRWVRLRADKGDDALIPRKNVPDMSVPEWSPYFLAEMQRPQKPCRASAWEVMAKSLQSLGKEVPSYSAVCRWYRGKYSKLDAQKGRNTGSAMNPHKFCHKRTADGMWPLLEVHSDGWNTHSTAPHPVSSKQVTLEVWHSHDVATRKAYVHDRSIGLSESMIVILGSLYAVCAEDGEPVVWQTDNTGSVKNDRVEFDPVTSVAARRGTSIVHNIPGNSQGNGIAENFNKYLDERSKELATYQGKGMDSLTHKRVFKITQKMVKAKTSGDNAGAEALRLEAERVGRGIVFASYQEAVDWLKRVVAEFNDMPHRELPKIVCPVSGKKRHMTPNEMMASFIAEGWKRQPLVGADLEDAFYVHERKTVTRGVVTIMGQSYHHTDMDNLNGETVMVAYDIQDGSRVWIKDIDGVLICEATFYTSRNYRADSFYDIAMDKRADAQIKRLGKKAADIEAQRPGTVIENSAERDTLLAEAHAAMNRVIPLPSAALNVGLVAGLTAEEKYNKWLVLDEKNKQEGDLADEEERRWHKGFPNSTTYRAQKSMRESGLRDVGNK